MRLLHTSDWHLGRTFHGASLQREQSAFVDAIVELATFHRVDVVIIAGDLYDRAVPPLEAVALFDDAVLRLRGTGASVVAISGNHDSAQRVSVHDRLLSLGGVTIRGDVRRAHEPVLIHPADGGAAVAVYPIPYLDPPAASATLDAPPPAAEATGDGPVELGSRRPTHDAVTRAATARVRADLTGRGPMRSVVVAHTFVVGGAPSDSERDLSMGNIEHVVLDAFAGFDYVALGHLHGPQAFAEGRVAYSGSPLPYSFSEERHHKSVRIVELDEHGALTIERVPIDVGMAVRSIRGRLDELLGEGIIPDAATSWVRATLTDADLPHQAMIRLRRRYPRVVELRHEPEGRSLDVAGAGPRAHRRDATPIELVERFWTDQHGAAPSSSERELLGAAITAQLQAPA